MKSRLFLTLTILLLICCSSSYAGEIVSWGMRDSPDGNDFIAIAAGLHHSLALKSDGN